MEQIGIEALRKAAWPAGITSLFLPSKIKTMNSLLEQVDKLDSLLEQMYDFTDDVDRQEENIRKIFSKQKFDFLKKIARIEAKRKEKIALIELLIKAV